LRLPSRALSESGPHANRSKNHNRLADAETEKFQVVKIRTEITEKRVFLQRQRSR
jgi:hypothetical protein